MKKKEIIDLIKYHVENNDIQFRNTSLQIARDFDDIGDEQLSQYIMGLLSSANTFVPQNMNVFDGSYIHIVKSSNDPLPLPKSISDDLQGIINAVNHKVGINKFLFEGAPGTGKTESVKQVARLLNRQLFSVNFNELVDSKLGQTPKNVVKVFNDINRMPNPEQAVILFDEIDIIALDRVNANDIREMGRVTSTILKEIENLNKDVVLIATTNLFSEFDSALIRRFDTVINFDRYKREDLEDISLIILNDQLKIFKKAGKNSNLFKKIIHNMDKIPNPGILKNIIRTSLAFSNPDNEYDYLVRLFKNVIGESELNDFNKLRKMGFTIREMELLTGVSKSQISRDMRGE